MEDNRPAYNFTIIDIYGVWTLSVICLGFFLGPPVPCLHIFGGVIDARYYQKENVRRTSLLVITAWFWEKYTLQFSSCSRPQFFHLPVILTKELQHQGRHYLNSSGFPLPARDTDAFKGINISWAYTEKLGMKNVINTNIFQTRQRLIPNVSVFRRMLGYITKAVRESK